MMISGLRIVNDRWDLLFGALGVELDATDDSRRRDGGDRAEGNHSRPYLRRRTYNCVRVSPSSLAAFDLLCRTS